jgi:hypothetical protein
MNIDVNYGSLHTTYLYCPFLNFQTLYYRLAVPIICCFCFVCSVLHVCHLQATSLHSSYSTACHILSLLFVIIIAVWIQVQWLLENYEFAAGMTLPRSGVYNSYLRHCTENGLASVNSSSFGKLMYSVFNGLTGKRLGKRYVLSHSVCSM